MSAAELEAAAMPLSEVARRAGVQMTTAYNWVRDGRIPSFRFGTSRLVPMEAANTFLAQYDAKCGRKQWPQIEASA